EDLHEFLITKFSCNRPKNTGAAGVPVVLDQNRRVLIETDIGTVGTMNALGSTDDDRLDDVALLHAASGGRLTDRGNNNITDIAEFPLGTAQDTDAFNLFGAGIVGNLQITFLLNHGLLPPYLAF